MSPNKWNRQNQTKEERARKTQLKKNLKIKKAAIQLED